MGLSMWLVPGPGVADMHKTLNVVPRPRPSITPFPGSPIPPPALLPPPPSPPPLSHIKPLCGGGLGHLPRVQLHSNCFSLQLCSQKGFICETCHSSNVIYPFDTGDTYQVHYWGQIVVSLWLYHGVKQHQSNSHSFSLLAGAHDSDVHW